MSIEEAPLHKVLTVLSTVHSVINIYTAHTVPTMSHLIGKVDMSWGVKDVE